LEFDVVDTVSPSSISPSDFIARLARDDAPLVLDVRREVRFTERCVSTQSETHGWRPETMKAPA
jgi:hypothetical protein